MTHDSQIQDGPIAWLLSGSAIHMRISHFLQRGAAGSVSEAALVQRLLQWVMVGLVLGQSGWVQAEVFKCKAATGAMVYQDLPCEAPVAVDKRPSTTPPANVASPVPSSGPVRAVARPPAAPPPVERPPVQAVAPQRVAPVAASAPPGGVSRPSAPPAPVVNPAPNVAPIPAPAMAPAGPAQAPVAEKKTGSVAPSVVAPLPSVINLPGGVGNSPLAPLDKAISGRPSEPLLWQDTYQCAKQREADALTPECQRQLESQSLAVKQRNQHIKQCLAAMDALVARCGPAPQENNPLCVKKQGREAAELCQGL